MKTIEQIKDDIRILQSQLLEIEDDLLNPIDNEIIKDLSQKYIKCCLGQWDKEYETEIDFNLVFKLSGIVIDGGGSESATYFENIKIGIKNPKNREERDIDEELCSYLEVKNGDVILENYLMGYIYNRPEVTKIIKKYCDKIKQFNMILKETAEKYSIDEQVLYDYIVEEANAKYLNLQK